jgi:VanZ family protein
VRVLAALLHRWSGRIAQGGRYWLPLAGYAGLIFYLSSLSHPEVYVPSVVMELGDKVLHAIEYGVLGILIYRVFRHSEGRRSSGQALLLAFAASAIYGATDELHQAFVPLREADGWDLLTDAIGGGVAAWAWGRLID